MARLNANTVVLRGYEAVVLFAGDEVPDWAADQVGKHLTDDPATGSGDPSEAWKVADLKGYADTHGIDLGSATTKADILAVIQSA